MSAHASASKRRAGESARLDKASWLEGEILRKLGNKYRVLAQLGEGGTAKVWLALARGPSGFNKLVVLKTIRGELFDDPGVVVMFLEEARLAARLNHPNIVQTNEIFELDHHPVIVMEYLDGLPFSAVLERQRQGSALALAMLLRILSDALAGLHAAHDLKDYDGTQLSVVHRDVSPHNLLVTFTGQVKVLDFGIAQLSTTGGSAGSGAIKGKLRYIAPEQIHGETPIDCRADIYSIGVILWEIAAAERMWVKTPEATIMKRILSGELPKVRDVNPDIDTALVEIVEKALATRPSDRYASALDFQADLDQYVTTLGGSLRNRDIGRALSKMFEDVREERARMIETQLARSDTLYDIQLSEAPLPELTSFSNAPGVLTRSPALPLAPRALVLFALLAMSAFAVSLVFFERPPSQKLALSAPPPVRTDAADHAPPSTTSATVNLRVTAYPRNARITLDGVPLSSNPYVGRVPKDPEGLHQLLVEAGGYQKTTHALRLSHDQELVLHLHSLKDSLDTDDAPSTQQKGLSLSPPLVPSQPRPSQPRPSQVPPPRASQMTRSEPRRSEPRPSMGSKESLPGAVGPAAPAQPSCTPPYYYDARGIKRYRPECL